MSTSDIGTGLWGLAVHLFQSGRTPQAAFKELTLRTFMPCSAVDLAAVQGLGSLRTTSWYTGMCKRYAELRDTLVARRQNDIDEAKEVVASFYAHGCSASDFAEAVQTCSAMISFTIHTDRVQAFIEERCDEMTTKGIHELSLAELTNWILDGLVLDSLTPERWYASPTEDTPAVVSVRRVGLRVRPLGVAIEYSVKGSEGLRHRVVPLDGILSHDGPTGPIARRLAQSCGALLSETQLQRLLVKLQQLLVKDMDVTESNLTHHHALTTKRPSAAEPPHESDTPHPPEPTSTAVSSGSQSPKKRSSKPQKADVGLLYRDPEAALDNVDLNDADDVTLQEFKEVMNEKFVANALKPGDPGYEYDRRIDLGPPTQKSTWDEDSDDDDE